MLLEEIAIEFELGTALPYMINNISLPNIVNLAKTWLFEVGRGRVLNLDSNNPTCTNLIPVPQSFAASLRWI